MSSVVSLEVLVLLFINFFVVWIDKMISIDTKILILICNVLPGVLKSFVVVTSVVVEFSVTILPQEDFHFLLIKWVGHLFSQIVSSTCDGGVDGLSSGLVDALPDLVEVTREEVFVEDEGVLEAISDVDVLIIGGKHNHRCN